MYLKFNRLREKEREKESEETAGKSCLKMMFVRTTTFMKHKTKIPNLVAKEKN